MATKLGIILSFFFPSTYFSPYFSAYDFEFLHAFLSSQKKEVGANHHHSIVIYIVVIDIVVVDMVVVEMVVVKMVVVDMEVVVVTW